MTNSFPKRAHKDGWHATLDQALATPIPEGRRSALIMEHGTMSVRLYTPEQIDNQSPHEQDELYVVESGDGWFINGESRHRFSAGDILFVPAGIQRRFEEFDENLIVWVIFYGPPGGELTDTTGWQQPPSD